MLKGNPRQRVVVLGAARSGTTCVLETLRAHPRIAACPVEVTASTLFVNGLAVLTEFQTGFDVRKRGVLAGFDALVGLDDSETVDPVASVVKVAATDPGDVLAVLFGLRSFFDEVVVVVCRRRDVLARFASHWLSEERGVHHLQEGEQVEPVSPRELSRDVFRSFLDSGRCIDGALDLLSNEFPVIEVDLDRDLVERGNLDHVFDRFGLEPRALARSTRTTPPLERWVTNLAELRELDASVTATSREEVSAMAVRLEERYLALESPGHRLAWARQVRRAGRPDKAFAVARRLLSDVGDAQQPLVEQALCLCSATLHSVHPQDELEVVVRDLGQRFGDLAAGQLLQARDAEIRRDWDAAAAAIDRAREIQGSGFVNERVESLAATIARESERPEGSPFRRVEIASRARPPRRAILFGANRSGTTHVFRALGQHPRVASAPTEITAYPLFSVGADVSQVNSRDWWRRRFMTRRWFDMLCGIDASPDAAVTTAKLAVTDEYDVLDVAVGLQDYFEDALLVLIDREDLVERFASLQLADRTKRFILESGEERPPVEPMALPVSEFEHYVGYSMRLRGIFGVLEGSHECHRVAFESLDSGEWSEGLFAQLGLEDRRPGPSRRSTPPVEEWVTNLQELREIQDRAGPIPDMQEAVVERRREHSRYEIPGMLLSRARYCLASSRPADAASFAMGALRRLQGNTLIVSRAVELLGWALKRVGSEARANNHVNELRERFGDSAPLLALRAMIAVEVERFDEARKLVEAARRERPTPVTQSVLSELEDLLPAGERRGPGHG